MRPCEKHHELRPEACKVCHLYVHDERYRKLWGEGEIQESIPEEVVQKTFLGKAVQFAGALITHALEGFPKVPLDVFEERQTICGRCLPYYDRARNKCKKCSCDLSVKLWWAEQECPDGRWGRTQ